MGSGDTTLEGNGAAAIVQILKKLRVLSWTHLTWGERAVGTDGWLGSSGGKFHCFPPQRNTWEMIVLNIPALGVKLVCVFATQGERKWRVWAAEKKHFSQ